MEPDVFDLSFLPDRTPHLGDVHKVAPVLPPRKHKRVSREPREWMARVVPTPPPDSCFSTISISPVAKVVIPTHRFMKFVSELATDSERTSLSSYLKGGH